MSEANLGPNQGLQFSFPTLIDSTMLSTAACPRKFFYKFCCHLSASAKSIHLHAGGAFAHALQVIREAYYKDQISLEEAQIKAFREFINFWGDYEPNGNVYKDFVNTWGAVVSYFETYPPESDHIQPFIKEDGSPAVEFTFAEPLPINHPDTGEPLFYGGRADLIGIYAGKIAIVDEKTTYSFPQEWERQFMMRGQFIGYCWAAWQNGIEAEVSVVRGVGIQVRDIKHREVILNFPKWQIDRWYEQMLYKVHMIKGYYEKFKELIAAGVDFDVAMDRSFPLNFGNECSGYSGCEMMDLCTSNAPSSWFDTFERYEWSPVNKEGE